MAQLMQYPTTPTCVNSQSKGSKHYIEPIITPGTSLYVKNNILKILNELERSKIIKVENNYNQACHQIWSTSRSKLVNYPDHVR